MDSTTPDWRRRASDGADWLARAFERRVHVDYRALAAFRIAIGCLIVLDLLLRVRDFTAFYTDDGVLTTAALYSDYSEVNSLHAWLGDAWLVGLLFVVAAILGITLALGYRTRTVTILSWLLLFSLHNRNPMVLNGGDVLFRMLLFWGIFLPLGARWSIDARRRSTPTDTGVASMATAAVLAQVAIMYVSNFVHKTRGEEWLDGEAVAYIMTLDQFTVFLGPYLAEFPDLLVAFTYFWLVLMAMSPFLFVLTGWPRAVLATGFVGMHLGMAATMQISVFPLVAVAGLVLFYQTPVWDRATALADAGDLLDRVEALERRLVDAWPAAPSIGRRPRVPYPDEIPGVRPALTTAIPTVFLVLILVSNAHALGYAEAPPDRGQELLETTETDQTWQLFAPNPLKDTRWFVANATLANGERVDAFTGGEMTYDRPPNAADRVGTARWRKYLSNVYGVGNDNHESYLANYLCADWNRSHDTRMESVEIHVLSQRGTPLGGTSEVENRTLIEYDCSGPFVQS